MARVSSRNRAVSVYYNGQTANSLYQLADRVGRAVSRFGEAELRARAGLKRRMLPAARREIRKHFNVRNSLLVDSMRVQEHNTRKGDALAIWASARRISLIEFGGRWRGPARKRNGKGFAAPATAMVVKQGRQQYQGAFIATIRGRRAIRVRTYSGEGKRVHRGPVRMLYGPSPLYMMRPTDHHSLVSRSAGDVRKTVVGEMQDFYVSELHRLYQLQVGGRR